MRILLTGGSGFIGRNLIELMGHKHSILAPSSRELNLLDDNAVRNYLQQHKVDFVIHSATTPGHRNAPPVPDLASRNLRMFFNLARNIHLFEKMIYLGSGAVYDARHYIPRMREDYFDAHVPADAHGLSKYAISKYVEHEPRIIELRLFGVFGKYEDYEIRFISNAICKSLFGLPITIKQNRRFDYLYVNDLPEILEFFMEHDTGSTNIFNACNDTSIELIDLAQMVTDISDSQHEVVVKTPGLGLEYSGDNSLLRSFMPEFNLTPMDQAVKELYCWYSDNKHTIDPQLLLVDK